MAENLNKNYEPKESEARLYTYWTAARLKLKGIDGSPHKQWSMWFNSTQREEPYQNLTSKESGVMAGVPFGEP